MREQIMELKHFYLLHRKSRRPSIMKLNNQNQFLYLRKNIVNLCSFHKHTNK